MYYDRVQVKVRSAILSMTLIASVRKGEYLFKEKQIEYDVALQL